MEQLRPRPGAEHHRWPVHRHDDLSALAEGFTIAAVREEDLPDLLPLLRAYCGFYEVAPSDAELLAVCRALLADPAREGVQLLARRRAGGAAAGFATLYWTWDTLGAQRVGVMYDLFVDPGARGTGLADALVLACRDRCREHGAGELVWQTAPDNHRAQRVYDRLGARRSRWLDYSLPVDSGRER